MTTVLSKKGRVEIPERVRDKLGLSPGDDFDVFMEEEEGTITLRKKGKKRIPNEGLIELLRACPWPFEIPEREKDDTEPLEF